MEGIKLNLNSFKFLGISLHSKENVSEREVEHEVTQTFGRFRLVRVNRTLLIMRCLVVSKYNARFR